MSGTVDVPFGAPFWAVSPTSFTLQIGESTTREVHSQPTNENKFSVSVQVTHTGTNPSPLELTLLAWRRSN